MKEAILLMPNDEPGVLKYAFGQLAQYLNQADFVSVVHLEEGQEEQSIVKHFGLPPGAAAVGDTRLVFRWARAWDKLCFSECEDRGGFNLIASILHPEGHKVWGNALVVRVDPLEEGYLGGLQREDLIRLVEKRTFHTCIEVTADGASVERVCDNRWSVGTDCLANKKKTVIEGKKFPLLVVCDSQRHWVLSFVDGSRRALNDTYPEDVKENESAIWAYVLQTRR